MVEIPEERLKKYLDMRRDFKEEKYINLIGNQAGSVRDFNLAIRKIRGKVQFNAVF